MVMPPAMHQDGGDGGSYGSGSGGISAPTLWANYASCSTYCAYKTETHGDVQTNSSSFGLSETKQIMMQVETSPPASLQQISEFMMPINGVSGVLNTSSNLSFASGVSISESIVFENMQMGPSTGVMVMFLYQSHMIRMNVIGVPTLSALSGDSELTSTLSGISFQSSKPSDYGSSGGGSGDGECGDSSSVTVYPVYGNNDNPQISCDSGIINKLDTSIITLTRGPAESALNFDTVLSIDDLDDFATCDAYKKQNLSFPIAGKNYEALIYENCQKITDDDGTETPSMMIYIIVQDHLLAFVTFNITTLSNLESNSGAKSVLNGVTFKTRIPPN